MLNKMTEQNGQDIDKEYKALLELTSSDAYTELVKYYTAETFMDVAGIGRSENRHSSFLAWLFDETKEHGVGSFAAEKLLETLMLAYLKSSFKENALAANNFFNAAKFGDLHEAVRSLNFRLDNVHTAREWREWCDSPEEKSRLDICIEATLFVGNKVQPKKMIIAIENKIDSAEGENKGNNKEKYQTEHYWKLLAKYALANNIDIIVPVFLLPKAQSLYKEVLRDKAQKYTSAQSEQFFTLSYQYLLDGVLNSALHRTDNTHAHMLIEDYIRCLGRANTNDKPDSTYTVMATSHKEKHLISALWQEHGTVLTHILEAGIVEEHNGEADKPVAAAINYRNVYVKDKNLYLSVFLTTDTVLKDDFKDKEKIIDDLNKFRQSLLKRPGFKFAGQEYLSRKQKPQSLGWLVHELIKTYVEKRKDKACITAMLEEIKRTFNPDNKANLWIGQGCVLRTEFEKALLEHKNKPESNVDATLALSRYFIDTTFNLDKDIDTELKNIIDATKANKKKGISKRNKLIGKLFGIDDHDSLALEGDNPIKFAGDELYVARWWGETDIINLLHLKNVFENFYDYDPESREIKIRADA